jgi:hypothetical protein
MEVTTKKTTRDYREMLLLKGIGSELEKMAYPKIANLNAMLGTLGYKITPITRAVSTPEIDEDEEEDKASYKY